MRISHRVLTATRARLGLTIACVLGLGACAGGAPVGEMPRVPVTVTVTPALLSTVTPPVQVTNTPEVTRAARAVERVETVLTTRDGAMLGATLWRGDATWAVLAPNGDGKRARFAPLAEALAARGHSVLSFDWRGTDPTYRAATAWTEARADAAAAIAFARASGATRLLLAGGSLGGITSVLLGAEPDVVAVAVLGAPYRASPLNITAAQVAAIRAPMLFLASRDDAVVPLVETQWLHDQARAPKTIAVYDGVAHGIDLFSSPHRDDAIARILALLAGTASDPRTEGWRADLAALERAVREGHPKPFFRNNEAAFVGALRELAAEVPALPDAVIRARLMQLAAMFDGHTRIWYGQPAMDARMYALRLYRFSDGVFVVDAPAADRGLIGWRLEAVNDVPVETAWRRVSAYIERDNPHWVDFLAPTYLLLHDVLVSSGLHREGAPLRLRLVSREGVAREHRPEAVSVAAFRAQMSLYQLPQRADALWLSRRGEPFWMTLLDEGRVVYVGYTQVRASSGGEDITAFARRVAEAAAAPRTRRVIVDLRNNGGGDNTTYWPLLDALRAPAVSGRLVVLIGRNTFSAAANFATDVERSTRAVFAGEPMGGSPNLYGDTRTHTLPHSRIEVWVSARYWEKSTPDDPRDTITPTLRVALASGDWLAGRDPVLDAAMR